MTKVSVEKCVELYAATQTDAGLDRIQKEVERVADIRHNVVMLRADVEVKLYTLRKLDAEKRALERATLSEVRFVERISQDEYAFRFLRWVVASEEQRAAWLDAWKDTYPLKEKNIKPGISQAEMRKAFTEWEGRNPLPTFHGLASMSVCRLRTII